MATFLRTFYQDGKFSPAWWGWGCTVLALPLSLCLPLLAKLGCTLQLRGQIYSCFSSTLFSSVNSIILLHYKASAQFCPVFFVTEPSIWQVCWHSQLFFRPDMPGSTGGFHYTESPEHKASKHIFQPRYSSVSQQVQDRKKTRLKKKPAQWFFFGFFFGGGFWVFVWVFLYICPEERVFTF